MGFWIFMLAMGLLFPVVMILFGTMFMKSAPKKVNYIFGYRTDMSMKNRDTWEFAHKYIGKLWFRFGLLLIPITVIPMLFVIGNSENVVATVGLIVSFRAPCFYLVCFHSRVQLLPHLLPAADHRRGSTFF